MSDQARVDELETEITLILAIAIGVAMKAQNLTALRMLTRFEHFKKLADADPDGIPAAVYRKYGRLQ